MIDPRKSSVLPLESLVPLLLILACKPDCELTLEEACPSSNAAITFCDPLADDLSSVSEGDFAYYECGGFHIIDGCTNDLCLLKAYDAATADESAGVLGDFVAAFIYLPSTGRCESITYGPALPQECIDYTGPYICGVGRPGLPECPSG